MKISVICKLSDGMAYDFLTPLIDIDKISQISVFRDSPSKNNPKLKYFVPPVIFKNRILKIISRFFEVLINTDSHCKFMIGLYEIPHGLIALLVGKIKNIPVCVSVIGNPGYDKIRRGIRKKLTYFLLRNADIVTVCGNNSKKIIVEHKVDTNRVFILPNSIDINTFRGENKKKLYDIISIGRLSYEKNINVILEIAKKIKRAKSNLVVGIGGIGPEKSNLERLSAILGIEKNVVFLGYVSDLTDFYNSGKVFVLTSETEGLPKTLLEAMSCGVPSVVPDVGDISDVAKNGYNSYIINSYSDTSSYAEKILGLLTDKDKYMEMSSNSDDYVKRHYTHNSASLVWSQIIGRLN